MWIISPDVVVSFFLELGLKEKKNEFPIKYGTL
jgi:hypothetical protein